jgi:hypothetical protein
MLITALFPSYLDTKILFPSGEAITSWGRYPTLTVNAWVWLSRLNTEAVPSALLTTARRTGTATAVTDTNSTDFSIVLFWPDFMLVSECYFMKMHKNQWLLALQFPPDPLAGVTS